MTDRTHELAQAVLSIGFGPDAAAAVWQTWTVAQRQEAAAIVAPLLPLLERAIAQFAQLPVKASA